MWLMFIIFEYNRLWQHAACIQGKRLPNTLYIPKLRVRKNWYVGLNPDPTDHDHPDVSDGSGTDPQLQVGKSRCIIHSPFLMNDLLSS